MGWRYWSKREPGAHDRANDSIFWADVATQLDGASEGGDESGALEGSTRAASG
jgi:hypothetical protein